MVPLGCRWVGAPPLRSLSPLLRSWWRCGRGLAWLSATQAGRSKGGLDRLHGDQALDARRVRPPFSTLTKQCWYSARAVSASCCRQRVRTRRSLNSACEAERWRCLSLAEKPAIVPRDVRIPAPTMGEVVMGVFSPGARQGCNAQGKRVGGESGCYCGLMGGGTRRGRSSLPVPSLSAQAAPATVATPSPITPAEAPPSAPRPAAA